MVTLEQCTLPLTNLSSVLSWKSSSKPPHDIACQTVTAVAARGKNYNNRPKVLLCHDMKGGYLADRFDNGCFSCGEDGFGFSYWNWLNIDIFVYFSHQLVTIPPRSWIEVAKANGVKILGTFITEFDTGEKIWTNEMNSPGVIDTLVDKLVELSVCYGFDGWLLNIENKVCNQVALVQRLVAKLTAKTHECVEGGLVIWYDSVTYPDGKLKWQNELNSKNEAFFDSCDGIFLNYTWTPKNLNNSVDLARKTNRQFDVYVGVDVFGRNCFGGGGFNTRLAVEKIVQANLSLAIFAFGWVFETLPACDYLKNQQKFWNLLADLLPANKAYIVPFFTVFSTSHGKELFWLGDKCDGKGPWYCLPLQSPCQTLAKNESAVTCLINDEHGAFVGSSCLEIIASSSCSIKLFPIYFQTDGSYHLSIGYKWINYDDETSVSLEVTDTKDKSLCYLALQKPGDKKWQLESKHFQSSCQDGLIRLVARGNKIHILIGFVGICTAAIDTQTLSYDEIIEQIKCNVKLHNALIC